MRCSEFMSSFLRLSSARRWDSDRPEPSGGPGRSPSSLAIVSGSIFSTGREGAREGVATRVKVASEEATAAPMTQGRLQGMRHPLVVDPPPERAVKVHRACALLNGDKA